MLTGLARLRPRRPLATRAEASELLDGGELEQADVEQNLADLARMNRLPGGTGASVRGVRHLVGTQRQVRILDVGTGRADVPLAFARHGWRSVALDVNPQVRDVARQLTARQALVQVVEGNARSLPFEDGAFDVAHSSLLLHHLAPAEAVDALREMARVARAGIVVNDLRRGIWPLYATVASSAILGRSRVTLHDGLASARRAYTLDELDELLRAAGLRARWRSPAWLPRVVTAATPT